MHRWSSDCATTWSGSLLADNMRPISEHFTYHNPSTSTKKAFPTESVLPLSSIDISFYSLCVRGNRETSVCRQTVEIWDPLWATQTQRECVCRRQVCGRIVTGSKLSMHFSFLTLLWRTHLAHSFGADGHCVRGTFSVVFFYLFIFFKRYPSHGKWIPRLVFEVICIWTLLKYCWQIQDPLLLNFP